MINGRIFPWFFFISLLFCLHFFKSAIGQHDTGSAVSAKKLGSPVYTIYLSFDDGPLEGSEDIDDAVKKEDIRINVFVVGMHARANERMARFYKLYETNSFIEIGNHSFTHAHGHYKAYYEKPDSVLGDFIKNQGELGIKYKLARLPGRASRL